NALQSLLKEIKQGLETQGAQSTEFRGEQKTHRQVVEKQLAELRGEQKSLQDELQQRETQLTAFETRLAKVEQTPPRPEVKGRGVLPERGPPPAQASPQ